MIQVKIFFKSFLSLLCSANRILLIILFLILLLATLIYWFENLNFPESLYMVAITVLTIGYGDFAPKTVAGRILSIPLGFIGIVTMGIFVAATVKAIENEEIYREMKEKEKKEKEKKEMQEKMKEMMTEMIEKRKEK